MTIDDQIVDVKSWQLMIRLWMENYIMISKIDKYEYLTGEEILQAKFTYSPLGTAFEKQIKTTED